MSGLGLEGRVCLVTGAARGLGAAIVERLQAAGARVYASDVDEPRGRARAEALGLRFLPLDVRSESSWEEALAALLREAGRIDVLVNNAAILHMGAIPNTPPERILELLDVNAVGAYRGIRAVAPAMRAQGGGSIVNVGSIDSLIGHNGLTAYCASKWALRGLTKAAALELGRDGIRVNLVCPASGNPEMFAPWGEKLAAAAGDIAHYMADRAMPRSGEPAEIADAVLYLASDLARYVTGADLAVDGGFTAGTHTAAFSAF